MCLAIEESEYDLLPPILAAKADVDMHSDGPDGGKLTPLALALSMGAPKKAVKLLLDGGADVNKVSTLPDGSRVTLSGRLSWPGRMPC